MGNRFQNISTPNKPFRVRDTAYPEEAAGGRKTLPENRFRATLDEAYRKANPRYWMDAYEGADSPNENPMFRAGLGIRDFVTKGLGNDVLNQGGLMSGLAGATALGVPGMAVGSLKDWLTGSSGSGLTYGLLSGLLGLLGGGLLGKARTGSWIKGSSTKPQVKQAFALAGRGAKSRLIAAINSDPTLSLSEKNQLQQLVANATEHEAARVFNMLPAAAGAGIGAIIARLLLGAGTFGSVVGGLLGGYIGNRMSQPPARNPYVMGPAFG